MHRNEVIRRVKKAITILQSQDAWLLEKDLSEMSITHRLGIYIQGLFEDYDVDCEYNGDVDMGEYGKKRIFAIRSDLANAGLLKEHELSKQHQELINRSVFPDIIIHKRGNNENNLCIIEVKKSTSKVSSEYDKIKLKSYTSTYYGNNLNYFMGIFIKFNTLCNILDYEIIYFFNGEEIDFN